MVVVVVGGRGLWEADSALQRGGGPCPGGPLVPSDLVCKMHGS